MSEEIKMKQRRTNASLRTQLKSIGLIICLAVVRLFEWVAYALAWNGCTKYVPPAAVESLIAFTWQLWGGSAAIDAIILLLFLPGSLRRPRQLLARPMASVGACFLLWKALSLAGYVQHATKCGEARELLSERYPERQLTWLNADLLFWATVIACIATIATAIYAIARADEKRWMEESARDA